MKISNEIPAVYAKQGVVSSKSVQNTETRTSAPGTGADRVQLSEGARELQSAQQAVRQMAQVDLEKVNRIKAQLKEGTYKPDAAHTAANLLAESLLQQTE